MDTQTPAAPMTTEVGSAPEPTQTPAAETPKAPETTTTETPAPSWQELLDKVDAKELRKHPRIAGIVGSDLQRAIAQRDEREGQKQHQERVEREEKAFLELVEGNTDYIRENHPLVYQRYQSLQSERAVRDVQGVRGKAIDELATELGQAMRKVPGWQNLTPDDHEAIARELIGKSSEEVLPLFLVKAFTLLTERGVAKDRENWRSKDLAAEREALRKEITAELLKQSDTPDMTRPRARTGKADVNAMSKEEFDRYWEGLKTGTH